MRCELVGEGFGVQEPLIGVSQGLRGGGVGEGGVCGRCVGVSGVTRRRFEKVLWELREGRGVQDLRLHACEYECSRKRCSEHTQDTSPSRNL